MWEWLDVHLVHGPDPRWLMIRQSSGQRQKYEFIQIQSHAWENWRILQTEIEDGKVKLKNYNKLILTKNYLELMENRLSSSWIFSQDLRLLDNLPKKSRKTCKNKTLNLKLLKTESCSCRCSMIFIGREEETQNNAFQIPNKSRTTRRNSRRGIGHYLDLEAKRIRYGKSKFPPEGNWQDTANMMVEQFEESGHPVSAGSWNP